MAPACCDCRVLDSTPLRAHRSGPLSTLLNSLVLAPTACVSATPHAICILCALQKRCTLRVHAQLPASNSHHHTATPRCAPPRHLSRRQRKERLHQVPRAGALAAGLSSGVAPVQRNLSAQRGQLRQGARGVRGVCVGWGGGGGGTGGCGARPFHFII